MTTVSSARALKSRRAAKRVTSLATKLRAIRIGRASGKVILAGEHAAVYGFPAVAIALDHGAVARVMPTTEGSSRLRIDGIEPSAGGDLMRAFQRVLRDLANSSTSTSTRASAFSVDVSTSLPAGSGLGSSAAIGVAIIRGLDPLASEPEILRRAMLWERVFHGNPSGLDAFIASRGGCWVFERGTEGLPVCVPRRAYLCIGQSGAGATTKAMVDSVAALRLRAPDYAGAALARIGAISVELAHSLGAGDVRHVGRLMRENHTLLQRLSLSTHAIDSMCERARSAGAHGAKLTGGGGGGCVVAICETEDEADAVLTAWQRASFDGFIAPIGPREERLAERSDASRSLQGVQGAERPLR
jgi:mevalonate kinase